MVATLLLAATSIAVAAMMIAERVALLQGRQTDGVVVAIDVGVRGLKSVAAEFIAADGRRLVGKDIHRTQWFAANEVGDSVRLYYDPRYAGDAKPAILIERGPWIWSNPAFLLVAGVLLLWLGIYLARRQKQNGGGRTA